MGFAGRFELTVPDILQILSLSRKTGKLTLSRLENSAELLFKNGMVIFAACDSTRHTLSNILISQKRLTESALMAALELQHFSSDNKRLGAILIEKGIITHRVLQEALRYQIEQVISELLTWENGFFRFDMIQIAADEGVVIDVGELLGKAGIRPGLLSLDGTHRLDDRREAEMPRPSPVEAARPESLDPARDKPLDSARAKPVEGARPELAEGPPRPERFDSAHRPEPIEGLVEGRVEGPRLLAPKAPSRPELVEGPARPERFDRTQTAAEPFGGEPSTRAQAEGQFRTVEPPTRMPRPELPEGPVEGRIETPRPRPEILADLIEGQWQGERPPWIKSEASPSPCPEPAEGPPRPNPVEGLVEGRRPEPLDSPRDKPFESARGKPLDPARDKPLDSARAKPVEGARPELAEGPPRHERVEWLVEGPRSLAPEPRPRPERFDVAQTSAELSRMPRPERVEGLVEGPLRPTPEVPLRPAPAVTVRTPAPSVPTASTPPSQTSPAVPAAEAPQGVTWAAKEQQIPPSAAPSGTRPEGPLLDFEPSRITDEIMLSSPIAPWVLVMHLAADVVSRGVLLFVRNDGITGHDQFGVGGGRESGDERIINIKIPWNEPSILAATIHARTSYRGKIGPGKWNDTFLGQLGGQRPNEALIIPIIVAGKVVAIFYGDDGGTGTPLGDVQRLQALIGQTFSAVEASILEKRSKASA